jgi:glyoxylase-like metal-dependent hydrolase (beta-lactamase superfamily II)
LFALPANEIERMSRLVIIFSFAVSMLLCLSAQAQIEFRGIKHLAGDLYQVQDDNNTFTAFLVTPEGIILTDPINTKTATWLKAELRKQFDLPVKYLIYSHNHDGHSSGAAVYDEAIIIGQENIVPMFELWNDPSFPFVEFDGFGGDRNKFDAFRKENPAVFPHITFKDRMTIKLGGRTVNLVALGTGHGKDTLIVHYPEERAVLAVDTVWVDRLPYAPGPGLVSYPVYINYYPEYFDGLRKMESIDFDILIAAHGIHGTGKGNLGDNANVTEYRQYNEAVYKKVLEAIANGLSREQAVASIDLPQFKHLGMYDEWFKNNVSGMWRNVTERPEHER